MIISFLYDLQFSLRSSVFSMILSFLIALLCFALLYIALLCFALLCFALLCFALLGIALHCFALHCFALLCIALHCFPLLCYALQFESFKSAKKLIITVLFAIWEPQECQKAYNYCAFCNLRASKLPKRSRYGGLKRRFVLYNTAWNSVKWPKDDLL